MINSEVIFTDIELDISLKVPIFDRGKFFENSSFDNFKSESFRTFSYCLKIMSQYVEDIFYKNLSSRESAVKAVALLWP